MMSSDGSPSSPDLSYGIAPEGYRLPGAARVGWVVLQVGDLERSLDWYGQVLGFHVHDRAPGRAALGPAGGEVLIEVEEKVGATPAGRLARLGLFHFAILLPDRAALGRFVRHLSGLREPMGASDHRVSEALYLHDPDGLGVEVYADRPRDAWQHRDRQITMTTDPLDLEDLVRAGGAEPWRGMPAGTTMGHVHLHVGDLDRADDFYHRRLGLDRMVWSYPGALFLAAGGYHHHLGVNTWAAGARPPAEQDAQLLEWVLVVPTEDDVEATLVSLGQDPAAGVAVPDPWGTVVRVRSADNPYHAGA